MCGDIDSRLRLSQRMYPSKIGTLAPFTHHSLGAIRDTYLPAFQLLAPPEQCSSCLLQGNRHVCSDSLASKATSFSAVCLAHMLCVPRISQVNQHYFEAHNCEISIFVLGLLLSISSSDFCAARIDEKRGYSLLLYQYVQRACF
ncbi:hypothetical protein GL50803_005629 [Giardia duodenalis]|uniref:Uncharacterized protein n=1 Tax=Giardia intestinalis (strain ATCC 50803 / WB clone C6) TaxID=184922 RepID=A8B496_GIAIC|nr:hypothetical protein GL50803_005629 [Giardia intestinalis]KAE8303638.1 hypothetical protein GL50803_005629 [Giardia intestinalis]|eukprot:XP_001709527.1 Hypothetical protein GL50803_5629 [Giardia lamblia ATCC 50803]